MAGHQAATSVCWSNTRTFPGLVSSGQTIRMLKYHRHHHRAAGPIVDIVTSTETILVPVPVCPLSTCPRQPSQHCVDICVPSFSSRQCKYRADIQLEMWIHWSSSVLWLLWEPLLSPPPPRAREELSPSLVLCVLTSHQKPSKLGYSILYV